MPNLRSVSFIVLLLLIAATLTACPGPAPKPEARKYDREPTISLYINETGETKEMAMEEYLMGVVAAEIDPDWPDAALAAQAILARTFTLKKIQDGGVEKYGTDASTSVEEFQAYDATRINQKVREAVNATRGEVVTYQGDYINGWFFADGGGRTAASAAEGLDYHEEETPYIQSVEDPGYAITVPENKSWTAEFSLDEVRQAVREQTGQDPGQAATAEILETGPSGRATKVRVGEVTLSAPALRLALGSEKLRSTLLSSFTIDNGRLVVAGKGYGHGVGMSQWGARALAEAGKSPEEIVKYFFKGVEIEKHWD